MTVSWDVFRNFLRLLWDFQISKIHWMYLNQLNLFDSIESIWLNWIILKWLNLFETIFKIIDYKSQEQQWRKIFPVKFQKVEFPAILKLKSGFYTAKNIKKTFYDFFPIFPSNTFGNPFDFTRVIEFPIIYREKSLKNPDFFPVKSQSFEWNQN